MAEHYDRATPQQVDIGRPSQGLTPQLLMELGNTIGSKSSPESSPTTKGRADESDKYQMKPVKKKPPKDLPIAATASKQNTTPSPIYAEPNVDDTPLALRLSRDNLEFVENQGYLEPVTDGSQTSERQPQIKVSGAKPEYYNISDQYASTIYTEPPDASQTQENNNKSAMTPSLGSSKKKGFFNWKAKRKDPKHKSIHVYAEPEYGQNVGGIEVTDSGYTEFVKDGRAIFTGSSSQGDNGNIQYEPDEGQTSDSKLSSGCCRHCGCLAGCCGRIGGLFSSLSGRWKRLLLGLVVVVTLLVLSMIALAVYYTVFNGVSASEAKKACPSNQYYLAGVGESDAKVQWDENTSTLKGLIRSHGPGDIFLAGEITLVTYVRGDNVICMFNVTVEAEGRSPNQIFFDLVTSTTLSISWDVTPKESNNNKDTLYQISITDEYGTTRDISPTATRLAGSGVRALSYNFTDLMPGYGYSIIVSGPEIENELNGFKRTVPLKPGKVSIDEIGSTSIVISWIPAQGFFHGYHISYQAKNGGSSVLAGLVDKSVTEYIIFGLDELTTYIIFVETVSGTITSSPRILDTVMTKQRFSMLVGDSATRSLTVQWSPVEIEAGDRLMLQIQVDAEDENGGLRFIDIPNYQYTGGVSTGIRPQDGTSQHTLDRLTPGMLYRVQLFNIPPQQDQELLDDVFGRTVPTVPSNVRLIDLAVSENRVVQADIQWDVQPGVDGFTVTYEPSDGFPSSPIEIDGVETSTTITDLNTETTYQFEIRSFTGTAGTLRTESEPSLTAGNPIQNDLIIRKLTNTSMTVVWNIDQSTLSSSESVDKAMVTLSSDNQEGTKQNVSFSDVSGDMQYSFMGLTAGDTYDIVLSTIRGSDGTSYEESVFINTRVNTIPNSVIDLRFGTISSSSMLILWDSPDGQYSRFDVTLSSDGVKISSKSQLDNSRVELSLLTPNTEYTVSVVTISGETRSGAVFISEYTTSESPP